MTDQNSSDSEPKTDPIAKLRQLIDDVEIAMLVTRRPDGNMVSRPMANQVAAAGADFWFVTSSDSDKIDELRTDPHVNLTYYKEKTREWVSVAGTAEISQDRAKIRELYRPDWKMWFAQEHPEDSRAGTSEDPRIVLIGVRATSARYLTIDKPRPVVLFEVVKGLVTGKMPDLGEIRTVSGEALRSEPPA